jgi:hypothetical protein
MNLATQAWPPILALLILGACAPPSDHGDELDGVVDAGPGAAADASSLPPARLYVTIVSHNEDNCPYFERDDVVETYRVNRAATVALAHAVIDAGIAWNFQSDWRYLQLVEAEDAAAGQADTDGKNLIEWLATVAPGHVQVDAHSHEHGGYNYADVAGMLVALGAPDTGVVGGFVAWPAEDADWEELREPQVGTQTGYLWTPRILWGGASREHLDDLDRSGIWRPADAETFLTDEPSAPLPNVGTWWDSDSYQLDGVRALAARVAADGFAPGTLLTATVRVSHCSLDRPAELELALDAVAGLAALVAEGTAHTATLTDLVEIWRTTYQSRPMILPP